MLRSVLSFIGVLAALGLPAALAAEDLPAAMVLEVEGSAPPGLEEFAPIEAGKIYVLPATTTVAFNHLALCQTIRVMGGTLIVTEKDFSNLNGKVLSTENTECPEKITLKSQGVVSGVRLRAFKKKRVVSPKVIHWTLPVRPVIFLRGKNAASVVMIKVQDADKVVIELPVSRDPVVWPASAASLAYDTPYLIKLSNKKSGQVSQTWVKTTARGGDSKSRIIFLNVE